MNFSIAFSTPNRPVHADQKGVVLAAKWAIHTDESALTQMNLWIYKVLVRSEAFVVEFGGGGGALAGARNSVGGVVVEGGAIESVEEWRKYKYKLETKHGFKIITKGTLNNTFQIIYC